MALFFEFIQVAVQHPLHIREVIISLLLLIVLGGFTISNLEGIKLGDAIYFAFITALSVGYGDIHPETGSGKLVSVGIGLIGMLFVGITVAIATRSLAQTSKRHLPNED
jgi:voltage-gated potassium channel